MISKVKASRLNQDIFSKTSVMFSVSNINANFLLNFTLSKMPGIIQLNLGISTTQGKIKFVRGDNVLSYQGS